MKRFLTIILAIAMVLSMAGNILAASETDVTEASETAAPFYASIEDVTVESIDQMCIPTEILKYVNGVRIDNDYNNTGDEDLDGCTAFFTFVKDNDFTQYNQFIDYPNGGYSHMYCTTDPADSFMYLTNQFYSRKDPIDNTTKAGLIDRSVVGYSFYDTEISNAEEVDGKYIIEISAIFQEMLYFCDTLTIDPMTGFVEKVSSIYMKENGEAGENIIMEFTYGDDITIDQSPRDDVLAAEAEEAKTASSHEGQIQFSTVDLNGAAVTEEIMQKAKVVMLNFWESWCGPCINEMPHLQKLYEAYKDQGLLILGIYATPNSEADVAAIVDDLGITYPILYADDSLRSYETDYVPTTYFADGNGNLLAEDPVIGAKNYEAWEAMIKEYLDK